jgi:hypothetical protein
MKQLLIYDEVVPVTREQHGKFSLKQGNFEFARETNSVPVVAQEFAVAAMSYAIVFGQAADGVIPAAVLGVRDKENAFVAADGSWSAPYIPAFIRRYPFIFGTNQAAPDTLTLMVDESCPTFNKSGKGEMLFDSDGEQTVFLKNVLAFLGEYQAQTQVTAGFTRTLSDLGLLEPAEAHLPLPSDPERRLRGFLIVSRDKLRALPGDKLAELNQSGALELIYLHIFSLMNLTRLQEKMTAATA